MRNIISNEKLLLHFKDTYKGKIRAKVYDCLYKTYRKHWKRFLIENRLDLGTRPETLLKVFDGYFKNVILNTGRK